MLTKELVKKYSVVLQTISSWRGVPYTWNPTSLRLEMGSVSHILTWAALFLLSWTHILLMSWRLLDKFSSVSEVNRGIHILWLTASHLHTTLQLALLLQANNLLHFGNGLLQESIILSDKLLRKKVSKKEVEAQGRLLAAILWTFVLGAFASPPIVVGVFLSSPNQRQFVFSALPERLKVFRLSWVICGAYEVTWAMYSWASITFFLFLQFSFVFLSQVELKLLRGRLQEMYGTKRWVIAYRKLHLRQGLFNESFGSLALPYMAANTMALSFIGNYGTIEFFHLRHQLRLLLYFPFPFIATFGFGYELVMYHWMGSLHSLSSEIKGRSGRLEKNPHGFGKQVCAAYTRTFVPLKVKMGAFQSISKSTILSVMTFSVVASARLSILFPLRNPKH